MKNKSWFVTKDVPCIFWFDKVGKSLKPGLKTLIKSWIQKWSKFARENDGILVIATSDVKNVVTNLFSVTIAIPSSTEQFRFGTKNPTKSPVSNNRQTRNKPFCTEIIKWFLSQKAKSWNLSEDSVQLSFLSEITMATDGFQLGTIINILRVSTHESLRQKFQSCKKTVFELADFLPHIQAQYGPKTTV